MGIRRIFIFLVLFALTPAAVQAASALKNSGRLDCHSDNSLFNLACWDGKVSEHWQEEEHPLDKQSEQKPNLPVPATETGKETTQLIDVGP